MNTVNTVAHTMYHQERQPMRYLIPKSSNLLIDSDPHIHNSAKHVLWSPSHHAFSEFPLQPINLYQYKKMNHQSPRTLTSDYRVRSIDALSLNPISHGILKCQVPQGGGDSVPPVENPLGFVCVQIFPIPAKLMYNCRSQAKGQRQKSKIERIEEL